MNKILLTLLLFATCRTWAQDLPNMVPPSPTAFELTKYGDVQINETSGKAMHSVPLYTYVSGKLNLPISFSYVGDGVKVDQLSSWTGINWTLEAGGVISRTVKDRPDEMGNRYFHTMQEIIDFTGTPEGFSYLNMLESAQTYDTQADQFNFSFLGYSGSFYLDENLQPKLANYDRELKIEFEGGVQDITSQTIVITDPDGIKFYFGGSNGTEQTRLDFANSPNGGLLPTTAYYLNKIEHPFGDEIYLTYGTEPDPYNVKMSISELYTYAGPNGTPSHSLKTIVNKVYNGKFLSTITSNRSNFEVHFNSTPMVNQNYIRILDEIKVVRNDLLGLEDIKSFVLNYISKNSLSSSTRFFLEKIDFLNKDGIKEFDHHFEYEDPLGLPERLSYSKDYLGYYNGKANGSGLPKNNHPLLQSAYGVILADREPIFENAVKGALKKVFYPTGGFTTFDYEAPKVKTKRYNQRPLEVYCNLSEMNPGAYPIPDTKLTSSYGILETLEDILPDEDQTMVVNVDVIAQGSINHHYTIHVEVVDFSDASNTQSKSFDLEYEVYQYHKELSFNLLKDHSYIVRLELELPPGIVDPAPVDVDAHFKYSTGLMEGDGIGVRVKRVTDHSVQGPPVAKRYYYQKIEEVGDLEKLGDPVDMSGAFIGQRLSYTTENIGGYIYTVPTQLLTLSSESIFSFFPSVGQFYKYVTVSYGGDGFENGGVQREYRYFGVSFGINFFDAIDPPAPHDNNLYAAQLENANIFDGRVLEERYFLKKDGSLLMNRKIEHGYFQDSSDNLTNMNIKRYHPRIQLDNGTYIEGLYIGLYHTSSSKFHPISKTTTDYMEEVPLEDMENGEAYLNVSTQEHYEYTTYMGLPSKIIRTTSKEDITTETINLYPDDVVSQNSLGHEALSTSEKTAVDGLKKAGLHRISAPVQVSMSTRDGNNNILSHTVQRTNYQHSGNHIRVKNVQSLKGGYDPLVNPLRNTLVHHRYDDRGNPLELSKANGIHTVYIWGYNRTLPIAKIENAAYVDIPSSVLNDLSRRSDDDIDCTIDLTGTEGALRQALNDLRDMPELTGSLITTYTYDPLVGMTSMTDPQGNTIYYEYDGFERLSAIRDPEGNLFEEYRYNYKK